MFGTSTTGFRITNMEEGSEGMTEKIPVGERCPICGQELPSYLFPKGTDAHLECPFCGARLPCIWVVTIKNNT